MTDERTFTLHQVGQAQTDFAIIEDRLEAIYTRLARTPSRVELARMAPMGTTGGAGLVLIGMGLF
jgi:hypothetical protein